jgi:hypothetical protein
MTVSGLEVCLQSSFRWPFRCTARHDEDDFRTAGRIREEAPLHLPMSRPGVEGCKPAQRTFFSRVKFGPAEAKPLSRGPQ